MNKSRKIALLSMLIAAVCSVAGFAAGPDTVTNFQPVMSEIIVFILGCIVLIVMIAGIVKRGVSGDF
ncbi:MAG: hypothetical protein ACI4PQ_07025 [Butyricicoccaceae bacterium]